MAGLLHDIGKLFLLKVMEEIIKEEKSSGEISPALLAEVINSMHVEHGFHLMQKWSMPEAYGNVVRDHHIDQWDQGNLLLAMVRLVDQACNKLGVGMRPEPDLVLFAMRRSPGSGGQGNHPGRAGNRHRGCNRTHLAGSALNLGPAKFNFKFCRRSADKHGYGKAARFMRLISTRDQACCHSM